MKAKLRGTEIYFDVAGMQIQPQGKDFIERPVIFMLHGGPGGDHLRFKQHSLALQEVAQLVFIDHRGCGRSKKTKQSDYTLENNIEDVEALRQHLGLERINILGTSYGGMVAQGYAIRYPKHLDKLILVVTAPSYRFIDDAKKVLQERGDAKQIAICEKLWNGTFKSHKQVMDFFKQTDSLYSVTTKNTRYYNAKKSKTTWSYQALNEGFSNFLRHFDFIPQLKKITCPTLVLAGQEDWICPPVQAKIIAQHIPHAQLKIFKKCGHALAVDAHSRYIEVIKHFLKKKNRRKQPTRPYS
ncbi:MAG TPA: alpha/beta hydrolase [Gammaproteobacteria bacterium]|jgi:proline iminopeptidase|nr:alpha/beta hydrolase [Gammaproteobacteria bacterium]